MARRLVPLSILVVVALLRPVVPEDTARADEPGCDTVAVEYALSAKLELTDTPHGQGDGTYTIGPGTAVVRYEERDGVPAGPAELVAYTMTERFKIDSQTLFWKTHVDTDSTTTVASDACGIVAEASLAGHTLTWTSDVRGAHTDGTIACDGSLCGSFGAPPEGKSPLHVPPHDVRFKPWVFSPDMKSFKMASTWMSHSESPKQTAHIVLSGREVRRACVKRPACSGR